MSRLQKKHPLAIRWFHWINFPVLMIMIWSGLLIYWANDVYRIGLGETTLLHFFPAWFYDRFHTSQRLAEGMAWHFTFIWLFAINGLLYVCYLAFFGEWRLLLPQKGTLKNAWLTVLHDLHLRKNVPPQEKYNGAQRIAYSGIIVMGLGSLITGLAIYKPTQFAWLSVPFNGLATGSTGYNLARFLHFWLTIGFCAFFVVHLVQVTRAGWNNFRGMITGFELVPDESTASQGSIPPRSSTSAKELDEIA